MNDNNSSWDAAKGCVMIIIGLPLITLVCCGLATIIEPIRDFLWDIWPAIAIIILIATIYLNNDEI